MHGRLGEDVFLMRAAQQPAVPLRTGQRWLARYRTNWLAGLLWCRRSDRGHTRWLPMAVEVLIEGLALQTPRSSVASL